MFTRVKTKQELVAMRESGRMLATVLQLLKTRLETGMTTKDLARMAVAGIRCFLVGESLMRQRDVEAATRALLAPIPASTRV